jgi:hypothetical protein
LCGALRRLTDIEPATSAVMRKDMEISDPGRGTPIWTSCVALAKKSDAARFVDQASEGKYWSREPEVRPLP